MNKFFVAAGFLLILCQAVLAGEISGEILLKSKELPGRATNSNPNRKKVLKKYGMKVVRSARQNGGGLPPNAKVDERDYAIVFLDSESDGSKLKATERTVTVDQEQRRFIKHVTPVTLGSQVRFSNQDSFFHHIYCPDSSSMCVPEHSGSVTRRPDRLGKYELFCDIHPLMNAYVYVVPNDFYAMANGGKFKIKNVPPGTYTLRMWHPRLPGSSQTITVKGDSVSTVKLGL